MKITGLVVIDFDAVEAQDSASALRSCAELLAKLGAVIVEIACAERFIVAMAAENRPLFTKSLIVDEVIDGLVFAPLDEGTVRVIPCGAFSITARVL